MPQLTTLAAVFGGLFAGMIGGQLLTRGLRLLYALLGKSTGEPKNLVPKRRLWAIPLLLLHPGSWVLVGIPYLGYLAYSRRIPTFWGWFVCGFLLSLVLVFGAATLAVWKIRRKRSHAAGA